MKKVLKYNKIYEGLIVFSILYLVFFYDLLAEQLGFFDEFLALIAIFYIVSISLFSYKIRLYKNEIIVAQLLFFILILGFISNFTSFLKGNKTDIQAIVGDVITFYKAFVVYFALRITSYKFDSLKIVNNVSRVTKWLFYIVLVVLLFDVILKIFPQPPRYGIHSFELFFEHPSRYSFVFAFTFIVLYYKYVKNDKFFLLFILFMGLTSLRVKYFGFTLISFFLLFYRDIISKISPKVFFSLIVVFFVALAFVFQEQLVMYFSLERIKMGWSRGIILVTSFDIANDFFPIGTGFGTYSCYFSGKYYSWVYEMYGIDHVWGISKFYWGFVSDQFWPMVLGQFGYFGLLAYAIVIYQYILLFLKHIKNPITRDNRLFMIMSLLGMFLLLIDSSSDAIFTQNRAVVLFMLFALFINVQTNSSDEEI